MGALPAHSPAFEQGLALLQRLGGQENPAVLDLFASVGAAEFGRQCVEWVYGTVYHRPGLSLAERQLATIGALTALGYAAAQLHFHADAAEAIGCTRRQVTESITIAATIAHTATEPPPDPDGPGLTDQQRELVAIAACTALGTSGTPLPQHITTLLDLGGTREQVVETLLHLAFYAGFPAALNAIATARTVFAQRAVR